MKDFIATKEAPPAAQIDISARRKMTASCRDADHLPRVTGAGEVAEGPNGAPVQTMHCGVRVLAGGYGGEWTTGLIRDLNGVHEPQEEALFAALLDALPDARTMVELGCNWSYYSLWFLSRDRASRRAVGLEPDADALALGRRNAALNDLTMTFEHGSIGDPAKRLRAAPQTSLQALMDKHGVGRADILHFDIQGAEAEVTGALGPLVRAGRIGVMFAATHDHTITGDPLTHQKCLGLVEALGGELLFEFDPHEGFAGDGLIVANFSGEPLNWSPPQITRNRYSTSLTRNPLYDLASARDRNRGLRRRLKRWETAGPLALARLWWRSRQKSRQPRIRPPSGS